MKFYRTIFFAVAFVGLFGLMLLNGCENDSSSEGTMSTEGTGQIRMYLTDDPAEYEEVNIVVTRVEVHLSGEGETGGWIVVSDSDAVYNLLELTNGANAILADDTLEAGHYTQIRLYLDEGSNVVVDGVTYDLTIPSGIQSGLKLNHPFDIEPETLYELTLDFDAEESIHQTGNGTYMMDPVIRVQANAISGSIAGEIDPAESLSSVWIVAVEDTITTYADSISGAFVLSVIPEGTYDVTVTPTQGSYQDTTITDVVVIAQEETNLGIITLMP